MVVPEADTVSQGELESSLQAEQQKNNIFASLGRQMPIYAITLDQFQHTLCESGKNFGSMNMDEFLTSIWNAEESQAVNYTNINNNNVMDSQAQLALNEAMSHKGLARQTSLARQGSLTLPAPLCRKTVEQVWSEIHRGQQGQPLNPENSNKMQSSETAARQPTFGEMTLEDFLIKAGVVREHNTIPAPPTQQQQQHLGMYQSSSGAVNMSPNFLTQPVVGMPNISGGASNSGVGVSNATYQPMPLGGGVMVESSMYLGSDKRNTGYSAPQQQPQPTPVCYSGRVGNGDGYVSGQPMGPMSPASSEGMCGGQQVDSAGSQFGMDMGGMRGKKRIIDGPVEKVVERRQRRMIKNRESAARSRARKQAYTVELEAELNQLKEENAQLKQALAELERKRKQQYFEELKLKAYTKAQKAKEKLRIFRRNSSCPL